MRKSETTDSQLDKQIVRKAEELAEVYIDPDGMYDEECFNDIKIAVVNAFANALRSTAAEAYERGKADGRKMVSAIPEDKYRIL